MTLMEEIKTDFLILQKFAKKAEQVTVNQWIIRFKDLFVLLIIQ